MMSDTGVIGVIGAGVTGSRVVEHLVATSNNSILLHDQDLYGAQRLCAVHRDHSPAVRVVDFETVATASVVVLACGSPHAPITQQLLARGVSVVSLSDDVTDVMNLLNLHDDFQAKGKVLVVGAAASPGMTGLLLRSLQSNFDEIDEAHVALHGTGGPNCAVQHHRALAGQSIGWHDGEWLRRPGGSGRELCWFPEPVGAYDCYRAEMADPVLLKRGQPQLQRITARVSANRRDRFTARLPMLVPPHAEGGMGAIRIEVRGFRNGSRIVEIAGVAERVAQIAGVVGATTALFVQRNEISTTGACALGQDALPNAEILRDVLTGGIRLHQFVGT
jgi:saccharopine dehydrogenase-like NADP-dependent oxidoreductase